MTASRFPTSSGQRTYSAPVPCNREPPDGEEGQEMEEAVRLDRSPVNPGQLRRPIAEKQDLAQYARDVERAAGGEVEQQEPRGDGRGAECRGAGGFLRDGVMVPNHGPSRVATASRRTG